MGHVNPLNRKNKGSSGTCCTDWVRICYSRFQLFAKILPFLHIAMIWSRRTLPLRSRGLQQPWKPIMVRGQKRGSKDPSPILLCDMFPSPARPKGLVSVLTLQTLNIFTKHKGHNCLPSTSFLPGTEIWILSKGHCQLKFQWLSNALLFDFFPRRKIYF